MADSDRRDELMDRDRQKIRDAYRRFQPDSLLGLTEAEARARVEAVGGQFEADEPDAIMAMNYSINRVRVIVEDGLVTDASIG